MTRILYPLLVLLTMVGNVSFGDELITLAYHDVVAEPGNDNYAVSRSNFIAQMDFLKKNGYQPVTLSLLHQVISGTRKLPYKAILLTFDDGLLSYHDFVVPALKIYKFPSVAGIVTTWPDGKNIPDEYIGKLMNWDQIRTVQQSDLVEIVSHSHDLHHGIRSNPQGNEAAASITRQFFPGDNRYESEIEFQTRIKADMVHSITRIKTELGFSPTAIVWPYGKYDQILVEQAHELGLLFHMTLQDNNSTTSTLPQINRKMVLRDTTLDNFDRQLEFSPNFLQDRRFVELQLDPFIGKSNVQQEALLSQLLDRLQTLKVNMAIVSPLTLDGKQAFFNTQNMKTREDILNRVLHQIYTRLGIHCYLKLPESLLTTINDNPRLFHDLARLNTFKGVIFPENMQAEVMEKIKNTMQHYQPQLTIGLVTSFDSSDLNLETSDTKSMLTHKFEPDFAYITLSSNLDTRKIRDTILKIKGVPYPTYVSISQFENAESNLTRALRTIRATGIRNFGYAMDNYALNSPDLNFVTKELVLTGGNL